jgi:hypothetical protein
MLLQLVLVIGLGQQDTLQPQANDYFFYDEITETLACDSWQEVCATRSVANKAGFGSIALKQEDESYLLRFVFKGNDRATESQLSRLNSVMETELSFFVPTKKTIAFETNTHPEDSVVVQRRQGFQINVSSDFSKTPISREFKAESSSSAPKEEKLPEQRSSLITAPAPGSNKDKVSPQELSEVETELAETIQEKVTYRQKNKVDRSKDMTSIKEKTQPIEAEVRFAVIFGSFTKRVNAERHLAKLNLPEAVIITEDDLYRTGIVYDAYPGSELRELKLEFPKCWLLRNDL